MKDNFEIIQFAEKITNLMKTQVFRHILSIESMRKQNMIKMVCEQNLRKTDWFLLSDNYRADFKKELFREDREVTPMKNYNSKSLETTARNESASHFSAYSTNKYISQYEEIDKPETVWIQSRKIDRLGGFVPIESQDNFLDQGSEESEAESFIEKVRERKVNRDKYKEKMLIDHYQSEHQDRQKLVNRAGSKNAKKQKLKFINHFIEMDYNLKSYQQQSESYLLKSKLKPTTTSTKNKSRNKELLKNDSRKNIAFAFMNQKYDPLKLEYSHFTNQKLSRIKLANGVDFKQNFTIEKKPLAEHLMKKKLLFLKNNDMNSAKIKFNELLSYKKIDNQTNLGYCSTMKTIKGSLKQCYDSKISIQSKQPSEKEMYGSKRLIKVANKKILQQMLIDNPNQQNYLVYNKKSKVKKQGKVRFQNFGQNFSTR